MLKKFYSETYPKVSLVIAKVAGYLMAGYVLGVLVAFWLRKIMLTAYEDGIVFGKKVRRIKLEFYIYKLSQFIEYLVFFSTIFLITRNLNLKENLNPLINLFFGLGLLIIWLYDFKDYVKGR